MAAPPPPPQFPAEHWALLRPHGAAPSDNTAFFNVAGAFLLHEAPEHWWCSQHRGAAEMLYLFQFDGIALVDQLRSCSDRQLGRCAGCISALPSF